MAEDFKNAQFNRSLGGYSVDNYIDYMNGEYLKLEQHCKDSDRKLLFALRKLEALTIELQNNYSLNDNTVPAAISVQPAKPTQPADRSFSMNSAQLTEKELETAKAELEKVRAEAAETKKKSEINAVELVRAARTKAAEILREAEETKAAAADVLDSASGKADKIIAGAKLQADAIVAGSAQRARSAAEQILTEAALNSRKIIREAEVKANNACRDVLAIYKAAEDMYSEVSSFRGTLFSLYSDHIESIETITGSAHGLVNSVDNIVRNLESSKDKPAPAQVAEPKEEKSAQPEPKEEAVEEAPAEEPVTAPVVEGPAEEPVIEEESIIADTPAEERFEQLVIDDEPETEPEESEEAEEAETEADEDDSEEILSSLSGLSLGEAIGEYYDSFDGIPEDEEEADETFEEEPADEPDESEEIEEIEDIEEVEEIEEPEELEIEEPEYEAVEEIEEKKAPAVENDKETNDLIVALSNIFAGRSTEETKEEYEEEDEREYYDTFDSVPEEDDEDADIAAEKAFSEPAEPEMPEKAAESDDFELPEDVSGGTNVLDIVKNISPQTADSREDDDFADIEKIFSGEFGVSADEFNRVFSNSNAKHNIDEIRNQPDFTPEVPENPKKHSKF